MLKLRRTDPDAPDSTGATTEKWILRKAVEDLLPKDLVWRRKAQFDEGSGTVSALEGALRKLTGLEVVDRAAEAALYEKILRARYIHPQRILDHAGRWDSDARVTPD